MEKTEKTLRLPALLSLLAAIALVVCVKYITPVCTNMGDTPFSATSTKRVIR